MKKIIIRVILCTFIITVSSFYFEVDDDKTQAFIHAYENVGQ